LEADPAQQDVLLRLRSAHLQCSGGGEFLNGSMRSRRSRALTEYLDYEVCNPAIGRSACDQAIVPDAAAAKVAALCCSNALAAAVQLSQNGGTKRAQLLGETGSVKLDRVLSAHQYLSLR